MKFFEVLVEGSAVQVRRTEHRAADIAAFVEGFAALNDELDRISEQRGSLRVLVDLRAAHGRNDAEFEAAIDPHRRRLFRSGNAMAVLNKTQVGAMQIRRHLRADGVDALVFEDENDAKKWLREA
ncbi:MAG: hypothetical protein ACE37F_00920 [Nannocystaceae bacterium]|nr:hypothetical protein [bacterium]